MADQQHQENEDLTNLNFDSSKYEHGIRNASDGSFDLHEKHIDDQRKIISAYELYDLEAEIRKLKRNLENWREIILPVSSVLKWDKNWYPGAIIGGSTLLFFVLWLIEPSVLTTVSLLGLTLTISDYLVPTLVTALYKPDSWTTKKELELESICRSLVIYKTKVHVSCLYYYKMRSTRPKLFYLCTITSLVMLAYIGNIFNNLFLTYLFVTTLLLLPGMLQFGLLKKYGSMVTRTFSDFTENMKSKVGQAKED